MEILPLIEKTSGEEHYFYNIAFHLLCSTLWSLGSVDETHRALVNSSLLCCKQLASSYRVEI